MTVETIDPTEARKWDPAPYLPVDIVETASQKRWATEEKPRPMENLRFEAFQILMWLAILSVSVYAILMGFETGEIKDFATIVVAPIITIVASAAGYYFGSRASRQDGGDGSSK
ncbi:hypothetical protein [Archangium sp.]|uniref:hypothetical protein n=1 Tax=Archangium sp. TaxID=1872627 RepID=UPI002D5A3A56|nr:hypothetical protein [Archangium sp.]HYO54860.1 hypothetical protein [Archangium sp.]